MPVNGNIAPKSIVIGVADPIPQRGRRNCSPRQRERPAVLPGFLPPACNPRDRREQGRSVRFRRKPVGPDKLARRGGSDGLVEVRLADSTPRKRPAEDELFVGNMGSIQREIRTSMQREDEPTMETGLERIAANPGPSHHTRTSMDESVSDSEALGSRGGRPDRD